MIYRKKKSCLTLLEVIIATFLSGILLAVVLQTYQIYIRQNREMKKQQESLFTYLLIKQRIDKLFSLLISHQDQAVVFTLPSKGSPSMCLCFLYEGSADPDPLFNGLLRSLLFVDENRRLCLTTWSLDRESLTEVLEEGVLHLSFSFFHKDTNSWQEDWPEIQTQLPLWVRLFYETPEGKKEIQFQAQIPESAISLHIPPSTV